MPRPPPPMGAQNTSGGDSSQGQSMQAPPTPPGMMPPRPPNMPGKYAYYHELSNFPCSVKQFHFQLTHEHLPPAALKLKSM